jgi:hypothetical protein
MHVPVLAKPTHRATPQPLWTSGVAECDLVILTMGHGPCSSFEARKSAAQLRR